ncbi:ABC1 family protein-like protein [Lachnellula occidentalis]|uniref:ABC1 family protein-like protein n=1 Tax=Lachnellula occidentalis TaxID=215460 RepID=A0A8H8UII5_9HELO|nr:ABC1 family protein-like protein [Lachnellula occidentalis]
MKGFNFAFRPRWTCRQCRDLGLRRAPPRHTQQRTYSSGSKHSNEHPQRRKRQVLLAAAATGTIGATALAFSDDVKHVVKGMERTGRVITTLGVCVNDYRTTLNQNEKEENEAEKDQTLKACHKRCADRTLKVLEKNGSIFIKLGQHLSAMNYLLPLEWTTTFIPLQDKCPVSSFESIEAMFVHDTGEQLSDYFSDFDTVPIGAASLAQVHLATVKESGQKVAVKVQHPSLAEWIGLDMALTRFTFSTLKKFFPEYDLEWLSSEMDVSLPQELDFALEGQNAIRAKEYFSHIPELPLVIPDVLWAKKRILVMENVSGHRPDDLEYLDANGIDRDEVSAALAHIFNEMIFGTGAPLHCDPHGGNLAIRKNTSRRGGNFDVILYDHGLYRDIPLELRRSYAKMWLAVIDADETRMRKYAKEVANIDDEQFPLFASAITGRDYRIVTTSIAAARSEGEKKHINDALGEGMLQQLVQMLGQVPRIILLILKTNDLTRSLDENLHTRQGPVRTFLILARYCSRTVFEEQVEELRANGSLLWPRNMIGLLGAWMYYFRVEVKLEIFEAWLSLKRAVGAA